MIYLDTIAPSSLGEDTFWTWFHREFPNSTFSVPEKIDKNDIAIINCAYKMPVKDGKNIGMVFELYPEMRRCLNTDEYDNHINFMKESAKGCDLIATTSHVVVNDFKCGVPVQVVPLGVNTDLFRPLDNKIELRRKYNIPLHRDVIFWSGTTHTMKGYDLLLEYARTHSETHFVIVWKNKIEGPDPKYCSKFCLVSQDIIAELMNASDYFLCANRLRPYFLVEWEAMACNLKPIMVSPVLKEFGPSVNPRNDVFAQGWDRYSLKATWTDILGKMNV